VPPIRRAAQSSITLRSTTTSSPSISDHLSAATRSIPARLSRHRAERRFPAARRSSPMGHSAPAAHLRSTRTRCKATKTSSRLLPSGTSLRCPQSVTYGPPKRCRTVACVLSGSWVSKAVGLVAIAHPRSGTSPQTVLCPSSPVRHDEIMYRCRRKASARPASRANSIKKSQIKPQRYRCQRRACPIMTLSDT
jgi:hypothetical protein